jgi:2-keto-4-pentenoate hydratase/2-oxohepta-3-ene-1,7-dioic acid hydratase in catechol pathway
VRLVSFGSRTAPRVGALLPVVSRAELMQSASTGDMVVSIPDLIADISSWITLEPGDVIATGTPAGVGVLENPVVLEDA